MPGVRQIQMDHNGDAPGEPAEHRFRVRVRDHHRRAGEAGRRRVK